MYKDKEKQKGANRKANERYRNKQKGITQGDTVIPSGVIPCALHPDIPLPDDTILACNKHIDWRHVLALDREAISLTYRTARAMGDDILLRLRRAAGYHLRTGR